MPVNHQTKLLVWQLEIKRCKKIAGALCLNFAMATTTEFCHGNYSRIWPCQKLVEILSMATTHSKVCHGNFHKNIQFAMVLEISLTCCGNFRLCHVLHLPCFQLRAILHLPCDHGPKICHGKRLQLCKQKKCDSSKNEI